MNDNRKTGGGGVLLLAATILPAGSALAQTVPVPQEPPRTIPGLVIATPTPSAASTPVPVPTGPVLGLPGQGPPSSATAPIRSRPPLPHTPARMPPAQPYAPSATATPSDRPTPDASPATAVAPAPLPVATQTPNAAPASVATPVDEGHTGWPWLAIGAGLVVVLVAAWAFLRRRAPAIAAVEPMAPAPFVAPPAPPLPVAPRARIAIALRPLRAGLNMLSAVVETEVIVTNIGDAPAQQVRVHATLLSAHAGQEADLAATFAAPPAGRPAAPPFALAPGEERRVRVVAALAREAVRSMDAAGRPMFVPLLAIDARYGADAAGTPARAGQAFVVGVERVDSAKLAPFWLDGPLRMYDQIAARVQGAVVVG